MEIIKQMDENGLVDNNLYLAVKEILTSAREKPHKAVNFAMVEAYWNVGKIIIESQN